MPGRCSGNAGEQVFIRAQLRQGQEQTQPEDPWRPCPEPQALGTLPSLPLCSSLEFSLLGIRVWQL